jgi:xanthine dehydrogenase iron-sulfur cluster and FAD-binding subunit A
MLWQHYYQPSSLDQALQLLQQHAGNARIVAGGTDVLVELQRGVKPTTTLIDITRLYELQYVRHTGGTIQIGGLATHNDVIASTACVQHALPLAQACWEVGAPQIRTRATIAGNLITASPANDTITPLLALGAEVVLLSAAGERIVPLHDFYTGFRKTAIQPNELLREIRLPALQEHQRGLFLKLGLRRAQAISVIDLAIVLTLGDGRWEMGDGDGASQSTIYNLQSAIITLGCLAPTIMRAPTAEAYLRGKRLTPDVCAEAGRLACADVAPIDDVRGSASYRLATLANLVADGLVRIAENRERAGWPERPVLLETIDDRRKTEDESKTNLLERSSNSDSSPSSFVVRRSSLVERIETTINSQHYALEGAHTKSLLDALREDAGLTGSKEGCAEGECGACTVWLNGQAVMACLVPAPQAQDGQVVTIEGLAAIRGQETRDRRQETVDGAGASIVKQQALEGETAPQPPTPNPQPPALHPLQQAFIDNAAVQCGYCIPGMLMAGAKLLDEQAHPSLDQIQTALSGNICRCTGYRKILDAVLAAARDERPAVRDERPKTKDQSIVEQ